MKRIIVGSINYLVGMGEWMGQSIKQSRCIGENIKRYRLANKLTQEQMAAKMQLYGCDMSRSTLAKIEAGIRHISVQELKVIKKELMMSYEDLFKE